MSKFNRYAGKLVQRHQKKYGVWRSKFDNKTNSKSLLSFAKYVMKMPTSKIQQSLRNDNNRPSDAWFMKQVLASRKRYASSRRRRN